MFLYSRGLLILRNSKITTLYDSFLIFYVQDKGDMMPNNSAYDEAIALTQNKLVKIVSLTREVVKETLNNDPNNILKAVDNEILDTTITNIAFDRIRTKLEI